MPAKKHPERGANFTGLLLRKLDLGRDRPSAVVVFSTQNNRKSNEILLPQEFSPETGPDDPWNALEPPWNLPWNDQEGCDSSVAL